MRRRRVDEAAAAKDSALLFELTPNQLTDETLVKSERGEDLHSAKDAEGLFDQLGV